jgi:muramidase (phage lysozyme)
MRDAIGYLSLLEGANVRAFLHTIRVGEGTADPMGYRRHFGGSHFDTYADHPRRIITAGLGANRYDSSAAGAYQFLTKTWTECAAALGLADFSPRNQDVAALFLIDRRRALDDVIAGRFEDAVKKCAREWASLPGSPYGQPTKTMAQALATYMQAGGGLESVKDTPYEPTPQLAANLAQPEAPMPIPALPLILGLANTLIGAFAPLAREKIEKEMARHSDNPEVREQIATGVIESVKALTGQADPIQATVQAMADPAIMEQVQADALSTLERLAPILDKVAQWDKEAWAASEASMDAAALRAKGEDFDMAPALLIGAFVVLGLLILLVGIIVAVQVNTTGSPDTATWSALTGLIGWATGIGTMMYAYRFGTTRNSGAKDVVIGELSRKR